MAEIIKNRNFFVATSLVAFILVGVLNVLPHKFTADILEEKSLSYHPYSLALKYDHTNVIGPRIREAIDGSFIVSEIDTYEHKDGPSWWPVVPPMIYSIGGLFTDEVKNVAIAYDFVFPIILTALIFILFLVITRRKWLSLFISSLAGISVFLSIIIPADIGSAFAKLNAFNTTVPADLIARWESFVPSLIPLLLALIFTVLSLRKTDFKYPVLAGLFAGICAYTYPFHFLYLFSTLVIIFFATLYKKDILQIKRLLLLAVTSAVVLIPFLINYLELTSLPHYAELLARHGVEEGRVFRTDNMARYILSVALAIVALWWGRRYQKREEGLVVASLLFSTVVVLNLQLFLGFAVQPDHWLNRDILWGFWLGYGLLLLWLYDIFVSRFPKWKTVLVVVGVLLIASASIHSVRYAKAESEDKYHLATIPNEVIEPLMWLRENAPKDSVVMTPSLVNNYFVPLETRSNVYIPGALDTIAPESEMRERLYTTYKLYGLSGDYLSEVFNPSRSEGLRSWEPDTIQEAYAKYEAEGILYLYALRYTDKTPGTYANNRGHFIIPDSLHKQMVEEYETFSCDDCYKKYRVDYLIYGPMERRIGAVDPEVHPFAEIVATVGETKIYKVKESIDVTN